MNYIFIPFSDLGANANSPFLLLRFPRCASSALHLYLCTTRNILHPSTTLYLLMASHLRTTPLERRQDSSSGTGTDFQSANTALTGGPGPVSQSSPSPQTDTTGQAASTVDQAGSTASSVGGTVASASDVATSITSDTPPSTDLGSSSAATNIIPTTPSASSVTSTSSTSDSASTSTSDSSSS